MGRLVCSVGSYRLTRFWFQRCLAFIYAIGFLIHIFQYRALVGEHGLLPIPNLVSRVSFWQAPSLFHVYGSDSFLLGLAVLGLLLSCFALSGFSERYGSYVSALVWALLWAIYLSYVSLGQVFYGFGWEALLLETGFLAIFLGSAEMEPPKVVIWLLRWVLFRLMFGAGLIKVRGDHSWLDLTAMVYHYQTQPIPNPISWYLHKFPLWYHKLEVLGTHFVELIVPWGYFFRGRVAGVAGVSTILFQSMLIVSGNLSWLNYLSIVLAISCLVILVVGLSVRPVENLLSSRQVMNGSFDALHLVNTYGAFGHITKERYEVVLQGTTDRTINEKTVWKDYDFKSKPGTVSRRPAWQSPYHRRLDWQIWFAAMSDYRFHPWLLNLIAKLLKNDPQTLGLIDKNPFADQPPHFIRAELYHYRFTTVEERKASGDWWVRRYVRSYLPPLSLDNPDFIRILRDQNWIEE